MNNNNNNEQKEIDMEWTECFFLMCLCAHGVHECWFENISFTKGKFFRLSLSLGYVTRWKLIINDQFKKKKQRKSFQHIPSIRGKASTAIYV